MGVIKKIIKKNFGNNLLFWSWSVKNRKEAAILHENIKYKNIHSGERCFILGNGPSLKTEDLSVLHDEIVFTVNQFYRSDFAAQVRPNYHFWADDNFFFDDGSETCQELIRCMAGIQKYNEDLISFFPLKHKQFIEDHEIDRDMHVSYFKSPLLIEDCMSADIDYSKFSLNFGTVVQWCITMAVYMGVKEIYLLGCDNTTILTNLKSALSMNDSNDYAYSYTDNEKKRMENMVKSKSIEAFLTAYLNNLVEYRCLNEYCQVRNINLVNCSSTTLIDCIPRRSLSSVIE